MSLVTVSAAEYECPKNTTGNFYVDKGDQYGCKGTIANAMAALKAGGTIYIREDEKMLDKGAYTIDKDVTIDLNGNTLTIGTNALTIKGANVTIKNGTIEFAGSTTNSPFVVDASAKATTLTFASDVKVKYTENAAVVKVLYATKATVVNVNGTWDVQNELVDCDAGKDKNLTVNFNATAKGTGTLVSINAGTTVVNVNGGSYETTSGAVFRLTNGTLNVNAGSIKSKGNAAIVVENPTDDYTNALTIKGEKTEISSENKKVEAVYFYSSKGTYSIADATITSGKDEDDEQLPALHIPNKEFLDKHPGMVKSGKFTGALVGDVKGEDGLLVKANVAQKTLVGNATVKR